MIQRFFEQCAQSLAHFQAALGGGAHGLDQGIAQTMGFELFEAGDGGAAWAGDFITQGCGMLAGFEHHACRSSHGLRCQSESGGAGQAHEHTAIGQRFDHGINVGWPAAAEAGDGIQKLFRNLICGADSAEDLLGQ